MERSLLCSTKIDQILLWKLQRSYHQINSFKITLHDSSVLKYHIVENIGGEKTLVNLAIQTF